MAMFFVTTQPLFKSIHKFIHLILTITLLMVFGDVASAKLTDDVNQLLSHDAVAVGDVVDPDYRMDAIKSPLKVFVFRYGDNVDPVTNTAYSENFDFSITEHIDVTPDTIKTRVKQHLLRCNIAGEVTYFGYRYYDANTGAWLSREPVGENESINLYSYCKNDPINCVDYLGLYGNPYERTYTDRDGNIPVIMINGKAHIGFEVMERRVWGADEFLRMKYLKISDVNPSRLHGYRSHHGADGKIRYVPGKNMKSLVAGLQKKYGVGDYPARMRNYLEKARLANAVYERRAIPNGWTRLDEDTFDSPLSGIHVEVFENTKGKRVIAFRGTQFEDFEGDWSSNYVQGLGFVGYQYQQANDLLNDLAKNILMLML